MPSSLSSSSATVTRPSSSQLWKQWGVLIGVVFVLPFTITYFHLYNLFHIENCTAIYYNNDATSNKASTSTNQNGILCHPSYSSSFYFVSTEDLRDTPPSIAVLATRVAARNLPPPSSLKASDNQQHEETTWDYSEPFLETFLFQGFSSTTSSTVEQKETSSTVNKYGFRSNNSKRSSIFSKSSRTPVTITTYFWLFLNIGLFLLYWQRHVPVQSVALNQFVVKDFGRSFSGNLAHFEWMHIGLNMLSLSTLGGEILESPTVIGSIPLFFYTASFLPFITLIVVLIFIIKQHWMPTSTLNSSSSFPNMVGFSGILFAWMVVATLQTQQKSCPIPVFPDLCFDVYKIGGFTVSLGPLVQLIFLQIVLPRASFVGHLAGIVVGFIWHWKLLPSLEWFQPCILYPLLWAAGKYYTTRNNIADQWTTTSEQNDGSMAATTTSGGYVLGGPASNVYRDNTHGTTSTIVIVSRHFRTFMIIHCLGLIFIYGIHSLNSIIVSEVIIVTIWTSLIRHVNQPPKQNFNDGESGYQRNNKSNVNSIFGMLGRGCVVFVLVACITDSMTLAGWLSTRILWRQGTHWTLLLLSWALRYITWGICLCLVCFLLDLYDELQDQQQDGTINTGVWNYALGWSVVDPCLACGKIILVHLRRWHVIPLYSNELGDGRANQSVTLSTANNSTRAGRRNLSRLLKDVAPNNEGNRLNPVKQSKETNSVSDVV